MKRYVLLLRGINVGKAKRVAMADLRSLMEDLGYTDVATILQSGNAVFSAKLTDLPGERDRFEAAFTARFGFSCAALIVDGDRFTRTAADDPLLDVATDPSKHLITFLATTIDPASIDIPEDLGDEVIEIRKDAIYQWLPDGIAQQKVTTAFWRSLGVEVTARNRRTVDRILAKL